MDIDFDSPLKRIAGILQLGLDAEYRPEDRILVYVGRSPETSPSFVSISRGQSQGLIYGYGAIAYQYTTFAAGCRAQTYDTLETLLKAVLDILVTIGGVWISGISPAQPVREGDPESLEITVTGEFLDRL